MVNSYIWNINAKQGVVDATSMKNAIKNSIIDYLSRDDNYQTDIEKLQVSVEITKEITPFIQ